MSFKLSMRSKWNLRGVHPDLQAVVHYAATCEGNAFIVTSGVRTLKRQQALVAAGASRTLRSRHLTGHAVDLAVLVEGKVSWSTAGYYPQASLMKYAAKMLDVEMDWGGDFNNGGTTGTKWVDLPHFQLDRMRYSDFSKMHVSDKALHFMDSRKFFL